MNELYFLTSSWLVMLTPCPLFTILLEFRLTITRWLLHPIRRGTLSFLIVLVFGCVSLRFGVVSFVFVSLLGVDFLSKKFVLKG